MPIWGNVELLRRAILDAGRKEAEAVLAQARAEAEKIVAEAKEKSERSFEEEARAQRSNAYIEAKRLVDSAELEAGKRIIAFREHTMEEMLGTLEARVKVMRNQPFYPDFLVAAVEEGLERLPGTDFIVELNDQDLEPAKEEVVQLAARRSLTIEIAPAPIEGGCRIYTGDRRMLYDNTFSARLGRYEDEIRREVLVRIFGIEKSSA